MYDNELTEIHRPPKDPTPIFQDLDNGLLQPYTRKALAEAEKAFFKLESEAQVVLKDLLDRTVWSSDGYASKKSLPLNRTSVEVLRKYFVFLRFRNSGGYRDTVRSLEQFNKAEPGEGCVYPAYRHSVANVRLQYILKAFVKFLNHTSSDSASARTRPDLPTTDASLGAFHDAMEKYCWRLCDAELCIGIASEDQEFMLSDRCFGTLDEGFDEDP